MNTINISSLKAHLSSVLDRVRRGMEVVILDRHTAIARIVGMPDSKLIVSSPAKNKFRIPSTKGLKLAIDPLDTLMEERTKR